MGAGSCEEHYMQDAGECYWVYMCQYFLFLLGINMTSYEDRESEFNDYCSKRGITECFQVSDYKQNLDNCAEKFIQKLAELYPSKKMDIINVEAEYRNAGKKGDFLIKLDDGDSISVSLKNYRRGYESIQLKSGTFHSFINNCTLKEADGPGMYIDFKTSKRFRAQGRSSKQRDENLIGLGYEKIIPCLNKIDDILKIIKEKYVLSEDTKYFNSETSKKWTEDCNILGNQAIEIVIEALDMIPNSKLKEKFLKDTDLCHTEELLLIGKNGDMMCSLFNEKYKNLLTRVNSEKCIFSYSKHEKNLRLIFSDDEGKILHIDVPFTLQKNGAWFIPKDKYDGEMYHKGEKKMLRYSERRPKKSKEMSTSTNMWFKIKDYL